MRIGPALPARTDVSLVEGRVTAAARGPGVDAGGARGTGAAAVGAAGIGAAAVGAVAVGLVAVGALAIGAAIFEAPVFGAVTLGVGVGFARGAGADSGTEGGGACWVTTGVAGVKTRA